MRAPAPSLIPEALAAVTVPSILNKDLSFCILSMVASGRACSSWANSISFRFTFTCMRVCRSSFSTQYTVYSTHRTAHSTPHTAHHTPHTTHRTPHTAHDNSWLSRFFSSFLLLFFPPLLSLSSLSSLHLDRRHLGIEETRLVRRLPRVLAKEEERRRYTVCEYTRVPGIYMGDLLCATAHLHRTRYNTTHDRE